MSTLVRAWGGDKHCQRSFWTEGTAKEEKGLALCDSDMFVVPVSVPFFGEVGTSRVKLLHNEAVSNLPRDLRPSLEGTCTLEYYMEYGTRVLVAVHQRIRETLSGSTSSCSPILHAPRHRTQAVDAHYRRGKGKVWIAA